MITFAARVHGQLSTLDYWGRLQADRDRRGCDPLILLDHPRIYSVIRHHQIVVKRKVYFEESGGEGPSSASVIRDTKDFNQGYVNIRM